ncbi:MAG: hypothetical protein MOGMAGMI_01631 [Candidatus Omnitrophica bacterium]|nr:hypothetical protein [Candidatus Omnitrophota bacterium]
MIPVAELATILTHPRTGAPLRYKGDHFAAESSPERYPVVDGRMVDLAGAVEGRSVTSEAARPRTPSAVERLNRWYNENLEQAISNSIFAGGGVGFYAMRSTIRRWLRSTAPTGIVLEAGCGDMRWGRELPAGCRYLPIDYLPAAEGNPWRERRPLINADIARLPLADASVDHALNIYVLEHVPSPEAVVRELARVLKPGGYLYLAGPGDLSMSHGEPHIYYNITRFAYAKMFRDCGLTLAQEAYPYKTWTTFLLLLYQKLVRTDVYNRHPLLKLLQAVVLVVSVPLCPLFNLIALLLDAVVPFDRRGYAIYMALVRKDGAATP